MNPLHTLQCRALQLLFVATLLYICAMPVQAADPQPERGGTIYIHELSDPEGLNPFITNDATSTKIGKYIFESMLELDYETAELYPVIAESRPAVSDDHRTYTFRLRNNVKFSDGKPLTAKDVVFSFKIVKNPLIDNAAVLRNYYLDVKDVVATNDYTVVVTMSRPYFLAEYFLGGVQILPKHILDPRNLTDQYTFAQTNEPETASGNKPMSDFAEWFDTPERNRQKEFLIGTGPYQFEEWISNDRITLQRADNYWNAGKDKYKSSYPKRLCFVTTNDRTNAIQELKVKFIDFMEYVPPVLFEQIDTTAFQHIAKVEYMVPTYMYIGWNRQRPVFSDKKTRQALSYLVDKNMLIKEVMHGFAIPTNSPIYIGRPEYDSTLNRYDYNVEKAKELLAEAGWSDSNGDGILDRMDNGNRVDFTFTFLINLGNGLRQQLVLLLIEEMKKVGIKAELQRLEWSAFLDRIKSTQFDAMIGAWVNDPTPSDPYQIWHSSQTGASNYVSFNVPRADELIELIRTEFDETKRLAYYREFQQIVNDEQPYTFLWVLKYPAAYNKRLRNVKFFSVRPGYVPNTWWSPRHLQQN